MNDSVKEYINYTSFLVIIAVTATAICFLILSVSNCSNGQASSMSLDLVGLSIVSTLTSIVVLDPRTDRTRTTFVILMLVLTIMLSANFAYWYMLEKVSYKVSGMMWATSQSLQILVYLVFLLHIYQKYVHNTAIIRKLLVVFGIALGIGVLFTLLNPITELVFSIDEHGSRHYTIWHYMLSTYIAALLISTIVLVRRFSEEGIIRVLLTLFLIMPLFGYVLQMDAPDVSFTPAFLAFGSVFIFSAGFISLGKNLETNQVERNRLNTVALTKQIAPHFMFNSLSAIMNLPGNNDESRQAIECFSTYLRNTLDTTLRTKTISIDLEIEQLKTFIDLKKLTYGDALDVKYILSDHSFSVPSLVIRSVISNYIRDNLASEGNPLHIIVFTERIGDIHRISLHNLAASETNRAIFREIISGKIRSVVIDRVELMCNGTVKHSINDDGSLTVTIEIPEVYQ